MTIQLKDSIFIAGVHQAAGTSLTLGADVEAELVNRGVAVYVGDDPTEGGLVPVYERKDANGNTVLVGKDGSALITIDASGNIIANVTPRTGTLTNLLTTVAGGVGEVSYATDWDAAVIHNGVAGGARILYCKPKKCMLTLPSGLTVPNNAMTVIQGAAYTVSEDTHSLYSAGVNGVLVPSDATHWRVTGSVQFAGNATGRRALRVGRNGQSLGTGLNDLFGSTVVSTIAQTVSVNTGPVKRSLAESILTSSISSLNINAFQDSGGDLAIVTSGFTPAFTFEFWRES